MRIEATKTEDVLKMLEQRTLYLYLFIANSVLLAGYLILAMLGSDSQTLTYLCCITLLECEYFKRKWSSTDGWTDGIKGCHVEFTNEGIHFKQPGKGGYEVQSFTWNMVDKIVAGKGVSFYIQTKNIGNTRKRTRKKGIVVHSQGYKKKDFVEFYQKMSESHTNTSFSGKMNKHGKDQLEGMEFYKYIIFIAAYFMPAFWTALSYLYCILTQ